MADRICRGVQGQNPCRGSRVLFSSQAGANCYVTVHIYFNVLCIKIFRISQEKGLSEWPLTGYSLLGGSRPSLIQILTLMCGMSDSFIV